MQQRQQVQPQRAIMAATNQSRPILANPSAVMPTVVRKRTNSELLSSNGVQQAKYVYYWKKEFKLELI